MLDRDYARGGKPNAGGPKEGRKRGGYILTENSRNLPCIVGGHCRELRRRKTPTCLRVKGIGGRCPPELLLLSVRVTRGQPPENLFVRLSLATSSWRKDVDRPSIVQFLVSLLWRGRERICGEICGARSCAQLLDQVVIRVAIQNFQMFHTSQFNCRFY